MEQVEFKVGKKFVRGDYKGRRVTETIKLSERSGIHDFLWNATDLFDKNKCNFIVEWYSSK